MNFVALQWLRKIDIQLIKIVKTEYSTELRSGQQLAALVPRIAPNIDPLLSRYSSSNVNKVTADVSKTPDEAEPDDEATLAFSRRIDSRDRGRGGARNFRGSRGNFGRQGNNSQQFCAGCFSLGKQLNTFINFKHRPSDCTRQGAVSRILQADGEDYPSEEEDFYEDGKKYYSHTDKPPLLNHLQNDSQAANKRTSQEPSNIPSNLVFTININQNPGEANRPSHTIACCNHVIEKNKSESHLSDTDDLAKKIRKMERRRHLWSADSVRKECSPMITALLNSQNCTPTIDEGSEINCIDSAFANRCNLPQVPTECSAKAAGNTTMMVTGQTRDNIVLNIPSQESLIKWDLAKCVVVENLGVDILIGEPGKVDNEIVTKSNLRKVETRDINGKTINNSLLPKKRRKKIFMPSN